MNQVICRAPAGAGHRVPPRPVATARATEHDTGPATTVSGTNDGWGPA